MATGNSEQKNIVRPNDDFYMSFEVRSERLITALYMVTNFFSDREPMKWKLRDAGLLLLSDAASLKDKNSSGKSETLVKLIYTMESIMALLEIARLADFISDMNYSVLNSEFATLKNEVEKRSEVGESVAAYGIPQRFFESQSGTNQHGNRTGLSPKSAPSQQRVSLSKFSPDVKNVVSGGAQSYGGSTQSAASQNQSRAGVDANGQSATTRVEVKKNKRRDAIVSLIQEKPKVSIKDITTVITDCSEKTIQRELVAMVDEGILKRSGERRWSKYSLNI